MKKLCLLGSLVLNLRYAHKSVGRVYGVAAHRVKNSTIPVRMRIKDTVDTCIKTLLERPNNHRNEYQLSLWCTTYRNLAAPSDCSPGGRGFNPRRGRQHSFVEIDHEIFSTVILSLPLIQEGQLSVSGERMCIILVNRLED